MHVKESWSGVLWTVLKGLVIIVYGACATRMQMVFQIAHDIIIYCLSGTVVTQLHTSQHKSMVAVPQSLAWESINCCPTTPNLLTIVIVLFMEQTTSQILI